MADELELHRSGRTSRSRNQCQEEVFLQNQTWTEHGSRKDHFRRRTCASRSNKVGPDGSHSERSGCVGGARIGPAVPCQRRPAWRLLRSRSGFTPFRCRKGPTSAGQATDGRVRPAPPPQLRKRNERWQRAGVRTHDASHVADRRAGPLSEHGNAGSGEVWIEVETSLDCSASGWLFRITGQ